MSKFDVRKFARSVAVGASTVIKVGGGKVKLVGTAPVRTLLAVAELAAAQSEPLKLIFPAEELPDPNGAGADGIRGDVRSASESFTVQGEDMATMILGRNRPGAPVDAFQADATGDAHPEQPTGAPTVGAPAPKAKGRGKRGGIDPAVSAPAAAAVEPVTGEPSANGATV